MVSHGRTKNGRFAQGNPGGPGRPRRAVEREYLAAFGDEVTLDDWRQIVKRAMFDAKHGDPIARAWISKYALGDKITLMDLAADETAGRDADQIVEVRAAEVQRALRIDRHMKRLGPGS